MVYIYSDESGSYGGKDEQFYVRSFVFISEKKHQDIIDKIKQTNIDNGDCKEMKADKMSNQNYVDLASNLDFRVVCFFTKFKTFSLEGYHFYQGLLDLLEKYRDDLDNDEIERYKQRARVYFLQKNYEKGYFNEINSLCKTYFPEYKIICDIPNNKKVLPNLLKDLGMNITFKDSKDSEGIQLADVVAGIVRGMLERDNASIKLYDDIIYRKLFIKRVGKSPKAAISAYHYRDHKSEIPNFLNKFYCVKSQEDDLPF